MGTQAVRSLVLGMLVDLLAHMAVGKQVHNIELVVGKLVHLVVGT